MNLSKTPLSLISSFLLVIALSFSAHLRADDKTTLVFSAIPDQDESRLRARFSKVAKYLEEKLEVPVKYVPVKSYAAAVTSFRNNQLQLAWFGGLSGVRARTLTPVSYTHLTLPTICSV